MDGTDEFLRERIRNVPDYPKKGILFRDITPLLKDARAFALCIDKLVDAFSESHVDYVVGIEARGFIIGSAVAKVMEVGFVPIRKEGKLPYKKITREYSLEYGTAKIEMHEDGVMGGDRVLVIDDVLATGGTARAAADLLTSVGAKIVGFGFVIELADLKGREKLGGNRVFSLLKY